MIPNMTRVRFVPIGKPTFRALAPVVQEALQVGLREEAKLIERDFDLTVKTWKRKPAFVVNLTERSVSVGTDNAVYGYVDEGTPPHLIRPKKAKALRFYAGGFRAKTAPNVLHAKKGKAAATNLTYTQVVHHPGTKARNFTTLIKERSAKRVATQFQKTLRLRLAKRG